MATNVTTVTLPTGATSVNVVLWGSNQTQQKTTQPTDTPEAAYDRAMNIVGRK
jgi:hypothetical protein